MSRQTVLTAITFGVAGFLAGHIYHAQSAFHSPGTTCQLTTVGQSSPTAAPPSPPGSLPPAPRAAPTMEQVQHTVRELQKQTTNNPKVPERLIALGNLSFDANKHEEAVEWYPKALALDPKDVHVRTDLGTSLHNLGRFDEALKGFRRALEYGPDHPQTLFNLAVTELVGKNDFGRAEEALRRLKQLNPDFPGIAQLEARIGQLRQERSSPAGSNPRP